MADLTTLNFDPAQTEDMGDCFKVLPPGHSHSVVNTGAEPLVILGVVPNVK